jgi:hypothetical protein
LLHGVTAVRARSRQASRYGSRVFIADDDSPTGGTSLRSAFQSLTWPAAFAAAASFTVGDVMDKITVEAASAGAGK